MSKKNKLITTILLIGSLFLFSIACHNNDKKEANNTNESLKPKSTLIDFQKSFQNPKLKKWVKKMEKKYPHFSVKNFEPDKKQLLKHTSFKPYSKEEWKTFQPYFIVSPNKNYAIDLYSYNSIIIDSGEEIKKSSPDSEINLVNFSQKAKMRLFFTGPGTTFDQVKWLNDSVIILTGESDANLQNKMLPISWEINIYSDSITTYHYKIKDSLHDVHI